MKPWDKEKTKKGKIGISSTGIEGSEKTTSIDINKLIDGIDNIHNAVVEGGQGLCPGQEFVEIVSLNWNNLPKKTKEKYRDIELNCQ